MQPYLFPYIGYFQLINCVDLFVLLDDVNYIMRGYINRNTLMINGKKYRFTVPVEKASQNKLIMDSNFCEDETTVKKILTGIEQGYCKTKHYNDVFPLIETVLLSKDKDITSTVELSIKLFFDYIKKEINIIRSSSIDNEMGLKSADRIVDICRKLGADTYINPQGGRTLYSWEFFHEKNIELRFLDVNFDGIKYKQFSDKFEDSLSIIDIMMNCEIDEINCFLKEYTLNRE